VAKFKNHLLHILFQISAKTHLCICIILPENNEYNITRIFSDLIIQH